MVTGRGWNNPVDRGLGTPDLYRYIPFIRYTRPRVLEKFSAP